MSGGLDLLVGGTLGAWALRNASPALVRQVVCLDDALIAVAAERGHEVFAGDPHERGVRARARPRCRSTSRSILRPALIDRYGGAIWNLHPGLLPYGRGMYPVFWALWEGTPAGATLHELTAGLDAGPIVEQREVAVLPSDTGGRLHERVQAAERELFLRWLPRLAAGARPAARPQRRGRHAPRARRVRVPARRGALRGPARRARAPAALPRPSRRPASPPLQR